MTIGERLLELSAEYARAKEVRSDWGDLATFPAGGRDLSVIASEYEAALKELLSK
ncbi:hypothetical protein [Arthrobacter sp. efr-133-R2A-63]|uniref:hypothetical protein n=1 Tax=Arthrobacter sp. efr-133-R2A-63 TaxID=3040278 RepID=UPI002549D5CD|nr:hypothetical protein [Arthrobacter sp. efr-133-R2A-63]